MKKNIGGEKKDQRSFTTKDKTVSEISPRTISNILYKTLLYSHQSTTLYQALSF